MAEIRIPDVSDYRGVVNWPQGLSPDPRGALRMADVNPEQEPGDESTPDDLPDEAVADQPEGEPIDTPDGEVDGGGEPADQQAWEG